MQLVVQAKVPTWLYSDQISARALQLVIYKLHNTHLSLSDFQQMYLQLHIQILS